MQLVGDLNHGAEFLCAHVLNAASELVPFDDLGRLALKISEHLLSDWLQKVAAQRMLLV